MRRFVLLALVGLLALCTTPAMADPLDFNLDVAVGKLMPEGKRTAMDDHAAVRLDMNTGEFFTFTGALTRTAVTREVTFIEPSAVPAFKRGHFTLPLEATEVTRDRNGYDYQLAVGFEGHFLGRHAFDPYVAVGVGAHRLDISDGGTSGFASWHAGAGLDLHVGKEIGVTFQALLARPFDQDDGEEYVEATVGLILGG